MIEYIKGDVTLAPEFVILQGCNAQGKMNSGVAKAIRDKWPEVFAQYAFEADTQGLVLGEIYPCFVRGYNQDGWSAWHAPDKVIINGITQRYYGRDPNVVYVDYDAIAMVLFHTKNLLEKMRQPYLAMPKLGSGLGGGSWERIESIINRALPDYWVKVYVP